MGTPRGHLSRRDLGTWVRYIAGTRSLLHTLDRRLRDEHELSMDDFEVLAALQRTPEPRMSELADLLSYSPSRLTNVVRRMEDKGWVERRSAQEDGRVRRLFLTPAGKAVLDEVWPHHAQAIRELFLDQLEPDDRRQVEAIFTRIRQATRE